MARTLFPLVAALALVLPPPSWADPPAPPASVTPSAPQAGPLAGRWIVEFANGVAEVCEIGQDGTASVAEPRRSSGGKVTARDGAIVVAYDDDRVERAAMAPTQGHRLHEYPERQLKEVHESPYRIIYEHSQTELRVVTIVHFKQRLAKRRLGVRGS